MKKFSTTCSEVKNLSEKIVTNDIVLYWCHWCGSNIRVGSAGYSESDS